MAKSETIIIFSIIFFGVLGFSRASLASECSNPKPEWIFYSCWEASAGSDWNSISDGYKWKDEGKCGDCTVVNNQPAGGPDGNAIKIAWPQYTPPDCSGGSNNFVALYPELPNPFYSRVYFYSESPNTMCGGRKFMYFKNQGGYGTVTLGLYDGGGNNVRLHIKNHTYSGGNNCATCEHLDGNYNWPGKESDGIIEPNRWYSIEFAHYRSNTNGWLKAWLDGKLVVNASKEAFGTGFFDTDSGYLTDWLEIPSYRNGGSFVANNEYLDNYVLSSSYIGPYTSSDTIPPAAPSGVTVS